MSFKKIGSKPEIPESISEFFEDYKDKKIAGILDYQSEVLQSYQKHTSKKDIAIELPTGSGKTLVALLISEWRRKKFQERVVYLCPTVQLVNQVKQLAKEEYGIDVVTFTGSQRLFTPENKNKYIKNEAVAVTTYAAFFRTYTYFTDPHIVVFDDAHAAENYISKMWTIEIQNTENENVFNKLIEILRPHLSESDYLKFNSQARQSSFDKFWVEKLPTPALIEIEAEVVRFLDKMENPPDDFKYPWALMRSNLKACHIYVSIDKIVIKPLIPPTLTHTPFDNAKQHIYMSATLGKGGDLERMMGVKNIFRIPTPHIWQNRAVGRRFFIFPESVLDPNNCQELIINLLRIAGRGVILTPSDYQLQKIKDEIECKVPNHKWITIKEYEDNPTAFSQEEKAILTLANRYDGIDLKGEISRLLFLFNYPKYMTLQESFISTRLNSSILYNSRITARITQAVGRCSRTKNDFSAVVVLGSDLTDFLNRKETKAMFNPELQAEISFGDSQSSPENKNKIDPFVINMTHFINQDKDWKEAELDIASKRKDYQTIYCDGITVLEQIANIEVDYQYAMWRGAYENAFERCREILGKLTTEDLKAYRILWNYLAGSALSLFSNQNKNNRRLDAEEYFKNAASASLTIPWFSKLANYSGEKVDKDSLEMGYAIDSLCSKLEELGLKHNRRFDEYVEKILTGVESKDSKKFEEGQVLLGSLLGFRSGKSPGNGAPDPWWIINGSLYVVFEDHSSAEKQGTFDAEKSRQAFCHRNWMKQEFHLSEDVKIISVIVSPKRKFDLSAKPNLEYLSFWPLEEFQQWTKDLLRQIKDLRTSYNAQDLVWRMEAIHKLKKFNLSTDLFFSFLKEKKYTFVEEK